MRIAFTTWQFVRLMVRLEESRDVDQRRAALWAEWRDDWGLLDTELERLREEDFAAHSELMMEREVVFEKVPATNAALIAEILEEVADQLASERKTADKARQIDLDFERAELTWLAGELAGAAAKKATGASD